MLSIPHSGEEIPAEFKGFLTNDTHLHKEDVDYKVNELVDIKKLQENGIGVLVAHVHRICVDLNRAEENCVMFWKNNTQGKQLVMKEATDEEVQKLIARFHRPYFEVITSILKGLEREKKNPVTFIDLHSMPSKPTEYHMKQNPNQKTHRPDFCVSDQFGRTCVPDFMDFVCQGLRAQHYETYVNDPYKGGHITDFADRFRTNNIQIEIKRSLYMDEQTKQLMPDKVKALIPALTQVLTDTFTRYDS